MVAGLFYPISTHGITWVYTGDDWFWWLLPAPKIVKIHDIHEMGERVLSKTSVGWSSHCNIDMSTGMHMVIWKHLTFWEHETYLFAKLYQANSSVPWLLAIHLEWDDRCDINKRWLSAQRCSAFLLLDLWDEQCEKFPDCHSAIEHSYWEKLYDNMYIYILLTVYLPIYIYIYKCYLQIICRLTKV